jgi:hypothetical protein
MECLATNGTWQDLNATGKALNGPYDSDSAFGCLHAQPGLARTAQVFCILFGVLSGVACAIVLLRDIASWTSSRGMFQQVWPRTRAYLCGNPILSWPGDIVAAHVWADVGAVLHQRRVLSHLAQPACAVN